MAKTLAELRAAQGLTQVELARRTGISFQTISEIENGRRARISTLRKLAEAFDRPVEEIAHLAGVEMPAPRPAGRARTPRSGADGLAPMGMAILGLLREQAMHPYEMVSRMRDRHVDMYIKVNFGAVYYHIDQLVRRGLIEVREVEREGNRPERTVYAITDEGHRVLQAELVTSMESMTRHYDPLDAGLHLAHLLAPEAILAALAERERHLMRLLGQMDTNARSAWGHLTVSQLHILRRHQMWLEAEAEWLRRYRADVEQGLAARPVTDPDAERSEIVRGARASISAMERAPATAGAMRSG